MKHVTLLLLITVLLISTSQAQKKEKKITGYAITAQQKGDRSWKEVRLVDMTTGEELQSIYKSDNTTEPLNARTGKAIAKKDPSPAAVSNGKKVVNLDMEMIERKMTTDIKNSNQIKTNGSYTITETTAKDGRKIYYVNNSLQQKIATDKPFATNSAAMAYDKKHDRLYYTPMYINQLRYIDLKSKTQQVYFFEDEAFGTSTLRSDIGNQITRMVIASDGDGYALSNDGNHLIRFTTGKNPVITDLGAVSDDAANAKSVHGRGGFGGDMIADASKNLYLITANRNVFKISIESKAATYVGAIKGLPAGFTTNGAMVESGGNVLVCSSESVEGYYRFDLNTLQAEKSSTGTSVFNASDLANGNLAFDKKKKDKKEKEDAVVVENKNPITEDVAAKQTTIADALSAKGISVYPNPVTDGIVKLSFDNLPAGKYQLQVLDLSGKLISAKELTINSKMQIEQLRLPELVGKGNYLVKVFSETNNVSRTTKLIVQ